MVTVAKGDASGIVDPHRTVVRDSQAWQSLWSAHAGPAAQAPAVDFATSMVLAAFAGERPTPGYSVEIVEPRQVGSSLVVTVTEAAPPRGMMAAQMIVTPFHIVALPRADGDIRFTDAAGSPFRGDSPMYAQPPDLPHPARAIGPPESPMSSATATSSTGLEPSLAAALAYLAGPFSGILILLVERANGFVLFHAWQAVIGLGGLGILSAGTLVFSFLTLLLSPVAFTVMYRLSEILAIVWVVAWVVCLIQAFSGRWWLMPLAGRYAERLATRHSPA
jgi:uncharacterized membrane protein